MCDLAEQLTAFSEFDNGLVVRQSHDPGWTAGTG